MVQIAVIICICFSFLQFAGCSMKQRIGYDITGIVPSEITGLRKYTLSIETFSDQRRSVAGNSLLFSKRKVAFVGDDIYCINAETNYSDGAAAAQITAAIAGHMKQRKAFGDVLIDAGSGSDFVLKGAIRQFYGRQDYSHEAAVLSHFGPIAVPLIWRLRSPSVITIELTELQIADKRGNLLKRLDDILVVHEGDLPVDRHCTSVYRNVNDKLKDAVTKLAEGVEKALADEDTGMPK